MDVRVGDGDFGEGDLGDQLGIQQDKDNGDCENGAGDYSPLPPPPSHLAILDKLTKGIVH